MGRTETGAGTGVPGTVQEVSIRGQRMGRTEARAGTGVPGTVQEVSIRGRGWADQRQELVQEFLGQFRRSVSGAEDGQHRGRSWYRSSWDSSGGQYQRMGRPEAGLVQEFLGQFRRSVSEAEDGYNKQRSWCKSSWVSLGGHYKGQRMGRTNKGAGARVPGSV